MSYPDPSKAYLAGLLHDLGIIVNLWVLPKEFGEAFVLARAEGIPLHEAEQSVMGFTHCESGRLLAEKWELSPDLREVVSLHHTAQESHDHAGLVALVELSDLLCRMSGLNYGYIENRQVNLHEQTGFTVLSQQCATPKAFDWAQTPRLPRIRSSPLAASSHVQSFRLFDSCCTAVSKYMGSSLAIVLLA